MKELAESRMNGSPMRGATVLFSVEKVPLPGIYLDSPSESAEMFAPLKIVQSSDGFVQTAHSLPQDTYKKYGFAGGSNPSYLSHLERIALEIQRGVSPRSRILEIGCGDGTLLRILNNNGFDNLVGIDPSPQLKQEIAEGISFFRGYFPADLPLEFEIESYDLILCRHVLEHIETPNPFIAEVGKKLKPEGQVWVEVPDLESTLQKKWWSNFYALHCNYFDDSTLDILMATHGFECIQGEVVPIFGGSLFQRFKKGTPRTNFPKSRQSVQGGIAEWKIQLHDAVSSLPPETWGWGAAERTAATFGFCPLLMGKLKGIVDGNPNLHRKFMAGANIEIHPHAELLKHRPSAIVLFAISYSDEILNLLSNLVPAGTPVLLPFDPIRWIKL